MRGGSVELGRLVFRGSLFLNKLGACYVFDSGGKMSLLRTESNPAFKIVQRLPRLATDLAAGRNCAVAVTIPRPRRGEARELKPPAVVPDRRSSEEGARPGYFTPM